MVNMDDREIKVQPVFRMCEGKDLPSVMEIDREAFFDPWSLETWRRELENPVAVWIVEEYENGIVGYAGIWNVAGEAQVMRVAVREALRNRGLGLLLMQELIRKSLESGAKAITLEVREHNAAALKLYEHCGFISQGLRPNYYEDTGEGAVIMWLYPAKEK